MNNCKTIYDCNSIKTDPTVGKSDGRVFFLFGAVQLTAVLLSVLFCVGLGDCLCKLIGTGCVLEPAGYAT